MTVKVWAYFIAADLVDQIKVSQPEKFDFFGRRYFYSAVQLSHPMGDVAGFGLSESHRLSSVIALMEAVERHAIINSSLASIGGSACHWSRPLGRLKAYCEMLERDALVRWSLELIDHREDGSIGTVKVLGIPTVDPTLNMKLAYVERSSCVPFGTACGKTEKEALDGSLRELAMSLIRHQVDGCNGQKGNYHARHALTASAEFKERLRTGSNTPFSPITNFEYEIKLLKSSCRFPLRVWKSESKQLFVHDEQWALSEVKAAGNSHNALLFRQLKSQCRWSNIWAG